MKIPFKRLLAGLLSVAVAASMLPAAFAAAEDNTPSTATLAIGDKLTIKDRGPVASGILQNGLRLNMWRSFTTLSDGHEASAYCANHSKTNPGTGGKAFTVTGRPDDPRLIGVVATGSERNTLTAFLGIWGPGGTNLADTGGYGSALSGLTQEEYFFGSQAAVWTALGDTSIAAFTYGGVSFPGSDALGYRSQRSGKVLTATTDSGKRQLACAMTLLKVGSAWEKMQYVGIYATSCQNGTSYDVHTAKQGAVNWGIYDPSNPDAFQVPTGKNQDGVDCYILPMRIQSATFVRNYAMTIRMQDAPAGAMMQNAQGQWSTPASDGAGQTLVLKAEQHDAFHGGALVNGNEKDYSADVTVYIPKSAIEKPGENQFGEVKFSFSASVDQYEVFMATPSADVQPYLVTLPAVRQIMSSTTLSWGTTDTPQPDDPHPEKPTGGFMIYKTAEIGAPLAGCTFTYQYQKETADGETETVTLTETTGDDGVASFAGIPVGTTGTLTETDAPAGYACIAPRAVTVQDTTTGVQAVELRDDTDHTLTIRKISTVDGEPLQGAVLQIQNINTGWQTTATTGGDGQAVLYGSDMENGSYRVEELTAPAGYVKTDKVETFTWDNLKDVTLSFENDPKPGIKVIKYDINTLETLPGAVFDVRRDGAVVMTVTTDATGTTMLTDLPDGYYELVEQKAPDGYLVDPTPHGINIRHDEFVDEPIRELRIANAVKCKFNILKRDRETKAPLPDFTFDIWHDGELIDTRTTGADGLICLDNLAPGTYTVKEVGGQPDYLLDAADQMIELDAYDPAKPIPELVFENTQKKGFVIRKIDADTRAGLPGVVFEIWRDAQSLGRYTTDARGYIVFDEHALPGTYTIQEVGGLPGYQPNPVKIVVEHLTDRVTEVTVTNTVYKGLNVVKLDGETRQPLAGVMFEIWRDNRSLGTFTTDENGQITLENAPDGAYRVQEKSTLAGYILHDEIMTVQHTTGAPTVLTVENLKKPGLLVKKVDAGTGAPLAGAVFRITRADGSVVREQAETDAAGTIHLPELATGDYIVTELRAPDGYLLSDAPKTVHLRENTTAAITFTNARKSGLLLKKVDADNPAKALPGAVFRIARPDGTIVAEAVESDAYGLISVPALSPGAYIITEIRAPKGYVLDTESKTVEVKADSLHTVTFTNTKESGLLIQKIDAATKAPLADAVFQITQPDGTVLYPELRTDGHGQVSVHDLVAGDYIVTEIQPPTGYLLSEPSSKTVHIQGGALARVTFADSKKSGLLLQKIDAATKAPLPGAVFRITKTDGTVVQAEAISDENGTIHVTDLLPGDYSVTEIKAPSGYVLDTASKTVTVKPDSLSTVTFTNTRDATAIVQKVDAATGAPLAGAVFTVTRPSGELVARELVTGADGTAVLPPLTAGSYLITETRAPDGYILSETPLLAEIKGDTRHVFTFQNSRQLGLQIRKVDAASRKPLAGARFSVDTVSGERVGVYTTDRRGLIHLDAAPGIYVVTEIRAPDGYRLDAAPRNVTVEAGKLATVEFENTEMSSIRIRKLDAVTGQGIYGVRFLIKDEANHVIGEFTTDQDGYIELDDRLTEGKYKVEEIAAAEGYVLDGTVRTLRVRAGETTELVVENTPILGQIQIEKLSAQPNLITHLVADTPLPGAVFEITDAETGRVVDTVTSDARGIAASKPLPLDRYLVQETKAPRFYQRNAQQVEVKLRTAGDVVRIKLYNDSAHLKTTIQKQGNAVVDAGANMRYDFVDIANESSVPLDNFFWHDRIPTDAVRAATLTTGTYSARVWYSITYKTNRNDYRTLARNLLTTNHYSFKIDSASLGLAAGEYVTDIRYVFGTVPAGFHMTSKATLYVYVPPYISDGYQIINRADAGGQYEGEWDSSTSTWTTRVYRPAAPAYSAPTLPKTGY